MSGMRFFVGFAAVLLLGMAGCGTGDDDNTLGIDKMLIVEAYVYAGEPITHVKLSKIHSGGSAESLPVLEASVRVEQGDQVFFLQPVPDKPGVYAQNGLAIVPNGYEGLQLTVEYGERTYTAFAAMPAALTGLTISNTQIQLVPTEPDAVLAQMAWNPIGSGPYCLFIRNLNPSASPTGHGGSNPENPFYQVVHNHTVDLKGAHFSHYGDFEIYVTAVNQEYLDLFVGGSGMSMITAPSNITNGFGVFTAFNGQAVAVHVE